jgi:hypothetical protein
MTLVRNESNEALPSDERTASQMIIPSPAVTGRVHQHRQRTLRTRAYRSDAVPRGGLRVRIGHLLIAVGSSLSGDVVERPGRPSTIARTA